MYRFKGMKTTKLPQSHLTPKMVKAVTLKFLTPNSL